MSRERFVIAECHGYLQPGIGSKGEPGLQVSVLDSAACFHVIRSWRSESVAGLANNKPRGEKRSRCRAEARELADRLNAGGTP